MIHKIKHWLFGLGLLPGLVFAQGLQNNGANIVIANSGNIYVDGGSNGKYTNQNGGKVYLAGTLIVEGDFTNNATNDVFNTPNTDGTLKFAGSSTIGGSFNETFVFEGVTVASGAGATVAAGIPLTIKGNVLNDGDFEITANSGNQASVITEGIVSGTGDEQVQQYLGTGGRYYDLGSPVSGQAAADVFDEAADGLSNDKLYEITDGENWTQVTGGNLVTGQGYAYNPTNPITLNYTGSLHTGSQSITLNTNQYTLLANPFPSALDWENTNTTNWTVSTAWGTSDVWTTVWYRTGGSFATYNRTGSASVNGGTRYIPAMQSFWINTGANGGILTITNAARVHNTQAFYKEEPTSQGIYLTLNGVDEALIAFNQGATSGYDLYDSEKMLADNLPQVYTFTDTEKMAINTYEGVSNTELSIPVGFIAPVSGMFSFGMKDFNNFDINVPVYLEDKLTGVFHAIRSSAYQFTAEEGTVNDRFVLYFNKSTSIGQIAENTLAIYSLDHTINVSGKDLQQIQVFDVSGKQIVNRTVSDTDMQQLEMTTSGIYVVQVRTGNGVVSQKVAIQ